MRPKKVNDTELIEKIAMQFRTRGFAGTNLSDLAAVTGLKKASLYHRFPGGKEEMAKAVLDYVGSWIGKNIISVLRNEAIEPHKRLNRVLKNINAYYNGGKSPCLMRSLSMDIEANYFDQALHNSSIKWLAAFTKLGTDLGIEYSKSEDIALQNMMSLQGSLILCKTLNSEKPFRAAMEQIKERYTSK